MTIEDTQTARQALASELHQTGLLYAKNAQEMSRFASKLENLPSSEASEDSLELSQARTKANYATLYVQLMKLSLGRIQNGEYDWEFLRLLRNYTDPRFVPDDLNAPSAS